MKNKIKLEFTEEQINEAKKLFTNNGKGEYISQYGTFSIIEIEGCHYLQYNKNWSEKYLEIKNLIS
jgi:hypothetical protein